MHANCLQLFNVEKWKQNNSFSPQSDFNFYVYSSCTKMFTVCVGERVRVKNEITKLHLSYWIYCKRDRKVNSIDSSRMEKWKVLLVYYFLPSTNVNWVETIQLHSWLEKTTSHRHWNNWIGRWSRKRNTPTPGLFFSVTLSLFTVSPAAVYAGLSRRLVSLDLSHW